MSTNNGKGQVRSSGLEFAVRMKTGTFLVVDDFDSMRKVTNNQLRQLGAAKIHEASNGAEALRMLQRLPITMILSDWNMPIMSGLELLREVRANDQWSHLPFLMITAESDRTQVMKAIQSGVSELLVKPYTAGRLAERIERALDWKPPAQPTKPAHPQPLAEQPAPTTEKTPATGKEESASASATYSKRLAEVIEKRERPTVLIVDDMPDNLHLLANVFKEEYRVKIAHNGAKALTICHSDNPPDLVLLDVMMPGIDGFEVARQMRSHPASEHIPIIFVTALSDTESRAKGMELGAVDFVTKPVDALDIKLRVRNFMRYIELHGQLQADYDGMLTNARLQEDVARITRHDIKAPLSGVLGLLQSLMASGKLAQDEMDMVQLAEETSLHMLDMINLSSELFKIESGTYVLDAQPVSLAKILRRIVELHRKTFAVKGLSIGVTVPEGMSDASLTALGDSMLCYSMFQNLIKNACEAAPDETCVRITVAPTADNAAMCVSIENTGAVKEEIRSTFFEKYITAGKRGGTGIGTYSARLLARAQNGDIDMVANSERDTTRVTVRLPAK